MASQLMSFEENNSADGSDKEWIIYNPFFIAANTLTVITSMILFYRGIIAPKPIRTALKLILLVTLSDFCNSVCSFLSYVDPGDTFCQAIAFVRTVSNWTALFWCSLISTLSLLTMRDFTGFRISNVFKKAMIFCAVLSTLISTT